MKLVLLLLSLAGCSLYLGKDSPKTAKGSLYSVDLRLNEWERKKNQRSDFVYQNKDGRILLSNSFCDEFQEQSLDRLARKTFSGISEFRESSGGFETFHGREAFRLAGTGMVDGVRVQVRLLNTRRNNCYFDFLAISPEKIQDSHESFEAFLQAVRFR